MTGQGWFMAPEQYVDWEAVAATPTYCERSLHRSSFFATSGTGWGDGEFWHQVTTGFCLICKSFDMYQTILPARGADSS